jgi:hypothetical protein
MAHVSTGGLNQLFFVQRYQTYYIICSRTSALPIVGECARGLRTSIGEEVTVIHGYG